MATCIVCGDPPEVKCNNCNKFYCGDCNDFAHKQKPEKTFHTHIREPFVEQSGNINNSFFLDFIYFSFYIYLCKLENQNNESSVEPQVNQKCEVHVNETYYFYL